MPVLRYFRVFNAEQAGGLAPKFHPEPGSVTEISQPQDVLDGYLRHGPRLQHVAGDRAGYQWRLIQHALARWCWRQSMALPASGWSGWALA